MCCKDFDRDAALAWAQAQPDPLLRLDEFTHGNASAEPGKESRLFERWQDVEELLCAGGDVWWTMDVEQLESLNGIVGGITGDRVRETVPAQRFDKADEVGVVDLPPNRSAARTAGSPR